MGVGTRRRRCRKGPVRVCVCWGGAVVLVLVSEGRRRVVCKVLGVEGKADLV